MLGPKMRHPCKQPMTAQNRNCTKYAWFWYPQQLLIHGQWWSIFMTQLKKLYIKKFAYIQILLKKLFKFIPKKVSTLTDHIFGNDENGVLWNLHIQYNTVVLIDLHYYPWIYTKPNLYVFFAKLIAKFCAKNYDFPTSSLLSMDA